MRWLRPEEELLALETVLPPFREIARFAALALMRLSETRLLRIGDVGGDDIRWRASPHSVMDEELSHLKYLTATAPMAAREVKYVVIVPRDQPEVHDRIARELPTEQGMEVLLDRRQGERRGETSQPVEADRRLADRRVQVPAAMLFEPSKS